MIYSGNVNQIKMCEDKMWDFNLTFLKCLFQNWHVSTEHLTFSISILLTENIFAGKKKFWLVLFKMFPEIIRAAHLKEECTVWEAFLVCLVFVFFPANNLISLWDCGNWQLCHLQSSRIPCQRNTRYVSAWPYNNLTDFWWLVGYLQGPCD